MCSFSRIVVGVGWTKGFCGLGDSESTVTAISAPRTSGTTQQARTLVPQRDGLAILLGAWLLMKETQHAIARSHFMGL